MDHHHKDKGHCNEDKRLSAKELGMLQLGATTIGCTAVLATGCIQIGVPYTVISLVCGSIWILAIGLARCVF